MTNKETKSLYGGEVLIDFYPDSHRYKMVGESSALVLIPSVESYEDVIRSTNNIPDAKILHASYLNIRDLFVFDKVLIPVTALDLIKANLG